MKYCVTVADAKAMTRKATPTLRASPYVTHDDDAKTLLRAYSNGLTVRTNADDVGNELGLSSSSVSNVSHTLSKAA